MFSPSYYTSNVLCIITLCLYDIVKLCIMLAFKQSCLLDKSDAVPFLRKAIWLCVYIHNWCMYEWCDYYTVYCSQSFSSQLMYTGRQCNWPHAVLPIDYSIYMHHACNTLFQALVCCMVALFPASPILATLLQTLTQWPYSTYYKPMGDLLTSALKRVGL